MELHFEYYVVEFIHQPYIEVERLVVVPACWMEVNVYGTGDRRIAVSYPAEHSPQTIRHVREKRSPHREWAWYCALIKFGNDEFNEAQKYIMKNSIKQKRKVRKTDGKKSAACASKPSIECLNNKMKDLKVLVQRLPTLEQSFKRSMPNISEKEPNMERPTVIKTTKNLIDTSCTNKFSENPDTNKSIEFLESPGKRQLPSSDEHIKNIIEKTTTTTSPQSSTENKLFLLLTNSSERSLTPHNENKSHLKTRGQEIIYNSPVKISSIEQQAHAANIPLNEPKPVISSPIDTSANDNLHSTLSENYLIQNIQETISTNISESINLIKQKIITQKTTINELKNSDGCLKPCVEPNEQKQCKPNNEIIDVDDSQQSTTNNKINTGNDFTTTINPCAQIYDQFQAIDYSKDIHETENFNDEAQIGQYIIQKPHSPTDQDLLYDLNKIIRYYQLSTLQPTVSSINTENHAQNIFNHIGGLNQQTHNQEVFSGEQFKSSVKELLRKLLLPRYGQSPLQDGQQKFHDNKTEKCDDQKSQAHDIVNDWRKIIRNLDLSPWNPTIPMNDSIIDTGNHRSHSQYDPLIGFNLPTQNSIKSQVLPKNIFSPHCQENMHGNIYAKETSNKTNAFHNSIHQKSCHQRDTKMSNNANNYVVDPGKVIIKKIIRVKPMPTDDSDSFKKDQLPINEMSRTPKHNQNYSNQGVDNKSPVQTLQDKGETTKKLRIEDIIFAEINKIKNNNTKTNPKNTNPPILHMPYVPIEVLGENTTTGSLHNLNHTTSVSSNRLSTINSENFMIASNKHTPGYKDSTLRDLLLQDIKYKTQYDKNKEIKNDCGWYGCNLTTLHSKDTNHIQSHLKKIYGKVVHSDIFTSTVKEKSNTEMNSAKINQNDCEMNQNEMNDDVVCIDDMNVFTTKGTPSTDESISTIFNIDEGNTEQSVDESFSDMGFIDDNNLISTFREKSGIDEDREILSYKDGSQNMVKNQNVLINNYQSENMDTYYYNESLNTLQLNKNESRNYEICINDNKNFTKRTKGDNISNIRVLPPKCDLNNTKWTLKYSTSSPGVVELIPGSRIYINETRLNYCLAKARNYNTLARKLLLEIFNYNALKVCYFNDNHAISSQKLVLDLDGKTAILEFLRRYGHVKGWPKMYTAAVILSLRNKLHELRRKFRLKKRHGFKK